MPEYFYYPKFRSTFVEKMKHLIKQNEIVDMCQSIIAVIAGKYLEQLVYENCTLEVSIIQRHANKSGKKIIIESTKDSDATIEVLPLCSHKCGKSKLWDFIAEFLPDYFHRDDILHYDIYTRYLENEELSDGDAAWIYGDFGSDQKKVEDTLNQMTKDFAYEALLNWLETHDFKDL